MSWGGDAKHGIIYRVLTVCRALYEVLPQPQAHGALQQLFSTSTLREHWGPERLSALTGSHRESVLERGVGTQSASLFTHHEDSKLLPVQINQSLKGRGQSQPVVRAQKPPSFWRLWNPVSHLYNTKQPPAHISRGAGGTLVLLLHPYGLSFLSSTE